MNVTKALFLALLASAPSAHARPRAKASSLGELRQLAQVMERTLGNASACEFRIEETRDGLTIRVRDESGAAVSVEVAAEDAISLLEEQLSEDGSAARLFEVAGQGSLRLVQAEDAFARAELTDRDGRVLSCQLDL